MRSSNEFSLIRKWAREDVLYDACEKRRKAIANALHIRKTQERKKMTDEEFMERQELVMMRQQKKELIERPRQFITQVQEPNARQVVMFEATLAFIAIQDQMWDAFFKLIKQKTPMLSVGVKLSEAEIAGTLQMLSKKRRPGLFSVATPAQSRRPGSATTRSVAHHNSRRVSFDDCVAVVMRTPSPATLK